MFYSIKVNINILTYTTSDNENKELYKSTTSAIVYVLLRLIVIGVDQLN